ncbi:hypothetical protein ABPG75_007634 [Micractinium tetrahymenae]
MHVTTAWQRQPGKECWVYSLSLLEIPLQDFRAPFQTSSRGVLESPGPRTQSLAGCGTLCIFYHTDQEASQPYTSSASLISPEAARNYAMRLSGAAAPPGQHRPMLAASSLRRSGLAVLRPLALAALRSAATGRSLSAAASGEGGAAAAGGAAKRGRGRPRKFPTDEQYAAALDAALAKPKGKPGRKPRPAGAAAAKGAKEAKATDQTVLLVESPAKAKKIQEFLGDKYKVLASYGHIRDLPAKQGSVQPEAGFAMSWQLNKGAEARMAEIAGAVRRSRHLVLATDPDREGEAISWHLLQELQARSAVTDATRTERITFTEVTKRAVEDALQQPRDISEPLVHAYMARRALDYLYGFSLSPMLWRKVPGARSAGRVQSVALRLVCEREAEIEAFVPLQYHRVGATLALPGGGTIEARLASVDGTPPPQPGFLDREAAEAVAARVLGAQWSVLERTSREQQRQPPAPFTTSTLQQEANNRLGMGASRTMQLAQQLYEAGHITYMRTDGVSLAPTAISALRSAVEAEFGPEYVPPEPRVYKARSKNAQEAHEAIRPTDPLLTAEQLVERGVERPAAKLYGLIRGRALACQMSPARIAGMSAELGSADGSLRLRASASSVAFQGFLAAYFDPAAVRAPAAADQAAEQQQQQEQEQAAAAAAADGSGEDEEAEAELGFGRRQQEAARAAAAAALAALQQGQAVAVQSAAASRHETRPPPRYTEGSLVKALEDLGIGRPGTYAPVLNLLQQRGYVRKEGRALEALALGRVLTAFLQGFFPQYVNYDFTSDVEEQLDAVSGGEAEWQQVLDSFWKPFNSTIESVADVSVEKVINELNDAVGDQLIGKDRRCPSCGSALSLKFGAKHRRVPFVGCSSYPDCTYMRPIAALWSLDVGLPSEEEGGGSGGVSEEEAAALIPPGLKGHVRLLGKDPSTGLPIFVRAGLYGPYVQRGLEGESHFRRQPLARTAATKGVTLETALGMLALPKELGQNPATGESIIVSNGKFGPFLRCGALSRSIPKDYDPITLTLADALQLLATKSRWSTARKDRKAAMQRIEAMGDAMQPAGAEEAAVAAEAEAEAAAAAAEAVAAQADAEAAAAAAADSGAPAPKTRGRKSRAELAAAAQAAEEGQQPGDQQQQGPQPDAQQQEPQPDAAQQEQQPPKRKRGRPPNPNKPPKEPKQRKERQAAAGVAQGDEDESPLQQRRRRRTASELDATDARQLAALAALEARLALDAAADIEVERLHEVLGVSQVQKPGRRGPSAFNLFLRDKLGEAKRTGQRSWGEASEGARGLNDLWKELPQPERQRYEEESKLRKQEAELRALGMLGAGETLDSLPQERQRVLRAEIEKRAIEHAVHDMVTQPGAVIKRPRTAFNFFTNAHIDEARADKEASGTPGGPMLKVAEMWRSAPLRERQKYKLLAMKERKQYQEVKMAVQQRRQEATTAALAAGEEPLAAARAGLEAGAELLREMLKQQQHTGEGFARPSRRRGA